MRKTKYEFIPKDQNPDGFKQALVFLKSIEKNYDTVKKNRANELARLAALAFTKKTPAPVPELVPVPVPVPVPEPEAPLKPVMDIELMLIRKARNELLKDLKAIIKKDVDMESIEATTDFLNLLRQVLWKAKDDFAYIERLEKPEKEQKEEFANLKEEFDAQVEVANAQIDLMNDRINELRDNFKQEDVVKIRTEVSEITIRYDENDSSIYTAKLALADFQSLKQYSITRLNEYKQEWEDKLAPVSKVRDRLILLKAKTIQDEGLAFMINKAETNLGNWSLFFNDALKKLAAKIADVEKQQYTSLSNILDNFENMKLITYEDVKRKVTENELYREQIDSFRDNPKLKTLLNEWDTKTSNLQSDFKNLEELFLVRQNVEGLVNFTKGKINRQEVAYEQLKKKLKFVDNDVGIVAFHLQEEIEAMFAKKRVELKENPVPMISNKLVRLFESCESLFDQGIIKVSDTMYVNTQSPKMEDILKTQLISCHEDVDILKEQIQSCVSFAKSFTNATDLSDALLVSFGNLFNILNGNFEISPMVTNASMRHFVEECEHIGVIYLHYISSDLKRALRGFISDFGNEIKYLDDANLVVSEIVPVFHACMKVHTSKSSTFYMPYTPRFPICNSDPKGLKWFYVDDLFNQLDTTKIPTGGAMSTVNMIISYWIYMYPVVFIMYNKLNGKEPSLSAEYMSLRNQFMKLTNTSAKLNVFDVNTFLDLRKSDFNKLKLLVL